MRVGTHGWRVVSLLVTIMLLVCRSSSISRAFQAGQAHVCFVARALGFDPMGGGTPNPTAVASGRICQRVLASDDPSFPDSSVITADAFTSGGVLTRTENDAQGRQRPSSYRTLWSYGEMCISTKQPTGVYILSVHAQNDVPGPVLIDVYAGETLAARLEFGLGDYSWSTKDVLLYPFAWSDWRIGGDTLRVSIRYVNDSPATPERDLHVAWLQLTPVLLLPESLVD